MTPRQTGQNGHYVHTYVHHERLQLHRSSRTSAGAPRSGGRNGNRSLVFVKKAAPKRRFSFQSYNDQPPPATDPATAARTAIPISSFFDASRKLIWPSDAPVAGDLGPKRDTSDQASLVVMELVEKHAAAPITTVTDARQKLIDYGQPALQLIRSVSTPQIAENFHIFMLSLYESLAAAANPPEITSTANPTR